jgi:hypothetical protein
MKKVVFGFLVMTLLNGDEAPIPPKIETGLPVNLDQIQSGISESARFQVRDGWGFGFNLQFNEYAASGDSREIAYESTSTQVPDGKVITFDSKYKAGFSAGFVLNTPNDHWNLTGNYLWFLGTEHENKDETSYFSPIFNLVPYDLNMNSFYSDWRLQINVADLNLSRAYYSGTNLTFEPLLGLKVAVIQDDFKLVANVSGESLLSQEGKTESFSWGVGPKLGVKGNWLLGAGFSLFGDISSALLYTTYTDLGVTYLNSIGIKSLAKNDNAQLIQPIIDTSVGINLGTYAWQNSFFINLDVSYNLAVFFSQNMARALVSTATSAQATPANLYLQGLSVRLSLEF